MRFLIAPDAFKGSLSAPEAAEAIAGGLRRAWPEASFEHCPLADGGEGTAAALVGACGGTWEHAETRDPLGRPLETSYGLLDGGRIAVIDVAAASGLTHLTEPERDPLRAGSAGTGGLIRHALDRGVERVWLGLGGSATVDGGLGMLCALGGRGLDAHGRSLSPNGAGLLCATALDLSGLDPCLKRVSIDALYDVDNPLSGPAGARNYMTQKGATSAQIEVLDAALARWGRLLERTVGHETSSLPGAGAAGGIGAAVAALGGSLMSGSDFVLRYLNVRRRIPNADVVIGGEGKLDAQTARGKVVAGLGRLARAAKRPLVVLCGVCEADAQMLDALGVDIAQAIVPDLTDEGSAMLEPARWLRKLAEHVGPQLKGIRSGA